MSCYRIAITCGEPAGIGSDLGIQLAQHAHAAELIFIADPELLQQRAAILGIAITIKYFDYHAPATKRQAGEMLVLPVPLVQAVRCGHLDSRNSAYVLRTIELAVRGCLQGTFAAMVTAPVHKGIINAAGVPFTGHTEMIAELTGGKPVMLLATPGLRVALVTTHLPLAQVSSAINATRLTQIITTLDQDLRRYFGLTSPRILVCALNPHAGENGHLGREEIEIIQPTLEQLRTQGLQLLGPTPADTAFTETWLTKADVVLAMYHDQGLPVLKYCGFGNAVNITLGLPIIRTSVDHGTALDLAGTGKARVDSLLLAVDTALAMVKHRQALVT